MAGFLSYDRKTKRGAYAELVVTRPEFITTVPDSMENNVAAAFPTGAIDVEGGF